MNRRLVVDVFCLCLAATLMRTATARPTNDEIKIGVTQEFENPNPLIKQMLATSYIYAMVGRTLNSLDADGKIVNQLAVSTPRLENGLAERFTEDGKGKIRARWEIIPNAAWGDGTPVTAHDVAFSRQVALSENVSVGEKEIYANVGRVIVDKQNPKKFMLIYEKADWDFYKMFNFYIIAKHLEEPVFTKYGDTVEGYDKNSNYVKDPTNPGLYNGPYRITEVKLGSHVALASNPHFYGAPAKIKRVIVQVISNTATLEANLRSGTLDMISVLGLTFDQALAFEKRVKKSNLPYFVNFRESLIYEHIDLNLRNPFLKDVRVRKAMVHGINRKALTDALFEGKQKPALHFVHPIDPWFTDDPEKIVIYPYSRRKAKKLLEETGWKPGANGYRYKNGEKLAMQLMTTSGDKTRENVQVFLQNEWKKIGIDITIKNEPARVYFGQTVRKAKYPGLAMYAWLSQPEQSPRSQLRSDEIPTEANGYSGQNSPGYLNPEVDELLEKLRVEFDADKRLPIIYRVLYHYTNDVPVIPLYYRAYISVTPDNLKGYQLTGHQYTATNHIENWNLQ